jgi:broad specificity phosphatase PhoE
MDILLIRHGDTGQSAPENFSAEKNRPDPPLNSKGREQAERLGRRLAGSGIQAVYTSDLIRAMQTTAIVNKNIGSPVEVRRELREIDMGRLHHCSWEEIRAENPGYAEEWHRHESDLPYPGGECGGDAEKRAMRVLAEITESRLNKVAVVTHGGILRVLVCAALGLGQEKRFRIGPPENTSITTIRYNIDSKEYSVYALNDASHLLKLPISPPRKARR